eukprot:Clim_evm1s38 gene=Clim_evmTU1s38
MMSIKYTFAAVSLLAAATITTAAPALENELTIPIMGGADYVDPWAPIYSRRDTSVQHAILFPISADLADFLRASAANTADLARRSAGIDDKFAADLADYLNIDAGEEYHALLSKADDSLQGATIVKISSTQKARRDAVNMQNVDYVVDDATITENDAVLMPISDDLAEFVSNPKNYADLYRRPAVRGEAVVQDLARYYNIKTSAEVYSVLVPDATRALQAARLVKISNAA